MLQLSLRFIHSTKSSAVFGEHTTRKSALPARVTVRSDALLWQVHLYHAGFHVCIHFAL